MLDVLYRHPNTPDEVLRATVWTLCNTPSHLPGKSRQTATNPVPMEGSVAFGATQVAIGRFSTRKGGRHPAEGRSAPSQI